MNVIFVPINSIVAKQYILIKKKCGVSIKKQPNTSDISVASLLEIIQKQNETIQEINKTIQEQNENHNKTIQEQNENHNKIIQEQNQLIEKLSTQQQPQIIHNHKTINDMSNNTIQVKFNINTYLNETCEEALTFEQSLPSIIDKDIMFSYEYKNKLTNRKLFVSMLNGFWKYIPQTLRPIQTIDIRRNKYYFKTKEGWLKSTDDSKKIASELFRIYKLGLISIQPYAKNPSFQDQYNSAVDACCCFNDMFNDSISHILKSNAIDKKLIGNYVDEDN